MFAVIVIARIGAVFANTFEKACEIRRKSATTAGNYRHTQKGIANLFSRNIRVPVAEPLILFADNGLDIFQLIVDALGFKALAMPCSPWYPRERFKR